MFNITRPLIDDAVADIFGGLLEWRLWHLLAWQEIKSSYRRSILGTWWIVLSMFLQILTMGFVMTYLFGISIEKHLPYLAAGMIIWGGIIAGIIQEGSGVYVGSAPYILQVKRPKSVYLFKMIWINLIKTAHNLSIYVLLAVIFNVVPTGNSFLLIITIPLSIISVAWIALFLAVLSARFRDVPVMVGSLMGVLFWLTPILYRPEMLGSKRFIVDFNPLSHVLELLRAPLMGGAPTVTNWLVVIGFSVVGWIFTLLFFARFRARIPYWL